MVTERRHNVYVTRLLPALLEISNNHFFLTTVKYLSKIVLLVG